MQVELDDLLSRPSTGVADPYRNSDLTVCGHLTTAQPEVLDLECGVRAAVPEREQRSGIEVARPRVVRAKWRLQVGSRLPSRPAGYLHRQAAGRLDPARKQARNRLPPSSPGIKGVFADELG